ncbi:MAG: leucine-rich repeat domain-containing protein [Candidatus Kariarchaeaceae archaeon]|jgi:hypothetical protein
MSDHDLLKTLLEKIGLEEKYDEVLAKKNVFGPTTKFIEDKLVWLDLSAFEISRLPDGLFDELIHLQELKLFKNEIQSLPIDIFAKLPDLTEIHLKDNKISSIARSHFTHQLKLQRLFLMGNPLPNDFAQNYTNGVDVRNFLNKLSD